MTYERVAVSIKATGADPDKHLPVEVAWWSLTTGERDQFVPRHDVHNALAGCDVDTVTAISYLTRLAKAPQDTDGTQAARLAAALHGAVLVSADPLADTRLLRRMFEHYHLDSQAEAYDQLVTILDGETTGSAAGHQPVWLDVLDVGSYAAGVAGLASQPDLPQLCEILWVPFETARTADSDVDALGRCVLRLTEIATDGGRVGYAGVPSTVELRDSLLCALSDARDQIVTWAEDGGSYVIEYRVVAEQADAIYGPAMAAATEQAAETTRQLHEATRAAQDAGQQWQAQLDKVTAELEQARRPVDDVRAELLTVAAQALVEQITPADLADQVEELLCRQMAGLRAEADLREAALAQELAATRDKLGEAIRTNVLTTIDIQGTPWEQLVVPGETELAVGPETAAATELAAADTAGMSAWFGPAGGQPANQVASDQPVTTSTDQAVTGATAS